MADELESKLMMIFDIKPEDVDKPKRRAKAVKAKLPEKKGPVSIQLRLVNEGYHQIFTGIPISDVKSRWRGMKGYWTGIRRQNYYYDYERVNHRASTYESAFQNQDDNSFVVSGLFERKSVLDMQKGLCRSLYSNGKPAIKMTAELPKEPEFTDQAENNIIGKFGLELEGGWSARPRNLRDDGSVGVRSEWSGEVSTTPRSPVRYPWTTQFFNRYPDDVNQTCGMHIHISFNHIGMHAAFCDERFSPWLMEGLKKWAMDHKLKSQRLMRRLNGRNGYCGIPSSMEGSKWLENQIAGQGGRYTNVNYSAWYKYKTMEIRVLPMFNMPNIGRKAVMETLRLVNLWGNVMGPNGKESLVFSASNE